MTGEQGGFGSVYLRAVLSAEAKCEADTDAWVSQAQGRRFPHAVDLLGRTLEIVEKAACCHWGCKNPSHDLERLASRIYNQATGALRLVRTGRYDEALSLIRAIGESTNLLALFALEPRNRVEWGTLEERERRARFAPAKVRIAIEAKGIEPAMDLDEYADLCEQAVHPSPAALPGAYNPARLSVLGGHLQPEGVIVAMCALVRAIGRCAVVLSKLMSLPTEQATSLLALGTELEASLGLHTAASIRERLRSLTQRWSRGWPAMGRCRPGFTAERRDS